MDSTLWSTFSYNEYNARGGVLIMDDTLTSAKKQTPNMNGCFGSNEDYLQFAISNTGSQEKNYTLSFMFKFTEIARDTRMASDYELPLKLVALNESDNETELKTEIKIPYRCHTTSLVYNKEFYEIYASVNVPASKTVRLQLKLNGDLPLCQIPDTHTGYEQIPHPVVYAIDNVAISSGSPTVISMKKGGTYQLQLDTMENDTVEYYTNSYLAKYTHSDKATSCTRFDTVVANVDKSSGLITAETQGETALIAVITHEDGTVERKQCIIKVEE